MRQRGLKRNRPGVASFTLLAALVNVSAAAAADPIRPEKLPIVLFNGRDLSGFYTWLSDTKRADPRRVFRVTDGMIHISGDGLGYLATRQAFCHYRLVAEFKWGTRQSQVRTGKARDSGIFLHSFGPDGNSHDGAGAFKAAIECNLFEGATGDLLLIRGSDEAGRLLAPRLRAQVAANRDVDGWFYWQRAGQTHTLERMGRLNWRDKDRNWRDLADFRGPRDAEFPPGRWNRVECICAGDKITIRVNGRIVNEAFDVYPAGGPILLQCEGSEIFFRKLELHPLTDVGD